MRRNSTRVLSIIAQVLVIAMLATTGSFARAAGNSSGAVYVLTNQPTSNKVLVYARAADGTLTFSGGFSTGGKGMGSAPDALGSQGSLVLARWHQLLFAVNAGNNNVSVFAVHGLTLSLLGKEPSGGVMPVSVAVEGSLVYVLNAGDSSHDANIQGFLLNPDNGHLIPLPDSMQDLGAASATGVAEVAFSPDGDVLMVTEKAASEIVTFTVDENGYAKNPITTTSNGMVPFGFSFADPNFAVVSEAGPSALSSYETSDSGALSTVTDSLVDGNAANCWVVVTSNDEYAFTTNTASGNISSYAIASDGTLTLLAGAAATTGSKTAPIDATLSANSHFLYVRVFDINSGTNGVEGFEVHSDGSLTSVGSVSGIPGTAQGIAAQ